MFPDSPIPASEWEDQPKSRLVSNPGMLERAAKCGDWNTGWQF